MRPSNKSRSRNKSGNLGSNPNLGNNNNNNNRQRLGNIINRVFESAGPDGKVRGTPQQIIDKYQALARDAQLAGDRVAAESFLQHSEHYSRMLGEAQAQQNEARQAFDREDGPRDDLRRDESPRGEGYQEQPRPRPEPQQQPQHQMRQPQHHPQPVIASSLTTIDPADDGEFGGLIETPESAGNAPHVAHAAETSQQAAPPAGANGASHAAVDGPTPIEAPAEPPKRSRPRRKAARPEEEPTGLPLE